MIGSPDLLAFSGADGFGEGSEEDLEAVSLPEELSVPLLGPDNPWSSCARFNRDFILVAEFSEQVGPSPVLTIPDDPRLMGSFDLNHFSVRIMSVDYQASGPAPAPHLGPGPRLNFSEDSRVVLGDSAEDTYAYVHHVTLLDLEARGMVRPFCMAYVCSDQAKLMDNFCELSSGFSRASDSLKTGNRQAFSMELQRKLQELEFKRLSLKQETALSPGPVENHLTGEPTELENVELSIHTHRELLRQVTSYPNRKLKQPDFLPYDPADSLPDSSPLTSDPCDPAPSPRPQHQLKTLPELCNPYFLTLMKEQLADTETRLRGDRGVLRTSCVLGSLSKRLPLTHFLFELWASDGEEEEEEEEREKSNAAAPRSSEPPDADPLSLESFFSCVEEIPIKMEAERRHTVTPDLAVSMEMTGSVSSSDSIEVLGTERSFRTQQTIGGCESKEPPALMGESSAKCVTVDVGVRRVRAYARRANSEDSIEVLSTTDSIIPEDLSAITEEAEHSPLLNDGALPEVLPEVLPEPLPVSLPEPPQQPVVRLKNTHVRVEQGTAAAEPPLDPSDWPTPGPLSLVHSLHVPSLSAVTRWSQGSTPARLLSLDERSDSTSATGSSEPPRSGLSSAQGLRRRLRRRRKAGLRALRFLKQHSFCQPALYCLLSGRPLVVLGEEEALVKKVVDGLRLFVPAPGPDERTILPSLTSSLQLTDLLTWRLIGIHRTSGSACAGVVASLNRYSRYLSVLDLDQRSLRAPAYSGVLIGRLAEAQCGFSKGLTYLLHLESELSALQNQALLYAFCPPYRERPLLTDCDRRVLHFLSDLMAQHHAGYGPPVLGFTYCSTQLHRNTAAP
ncbi:guanine nucleotide exchange protein SMCR8-like [Periophthalmus magnuspinnatus]|uniref:guanine nucleotide exchange protein SMCR8-like n=1 Tax=Periophthalmus magnuspinnatus TaxID=409849 RepID=UPI00145B8E65|nr:guanine nucleotide exchange protein SMCR8-like [Periophthalmus magnuspinnatus]XP_055079965.1 guanine nucleotide exchange protein SMCR8-like [Periophthalmus magnuspinnatus]